jgi:hypothetical protein
MMMDMQNTYATVFGVFFFSRPKTLFYILLALARGDRKRAMRRLHAGILVKNHHFSTFRSGIFIGLAVPALAAGLYHSMYP